MTTPAPLVSIVTPTYNSASTLPATIESVLAQTYPHIEYIIMDGNSTDNTHQVVQPYLEDPRVTFISEPDTGQAHAINKGWDRATGNVLAWLCADDYYLPHTVATGVDVLTTHPDVYWTCGNVRYINRDGDTIPFHHATTPLEYELYRRQDVIINQPTTLWRRELVDRFGNLREDLHFAMDLEFYLRIGRDCPGHFIDDVLAEVTWTRDTKTFGGGLARIREIESVIREYGGTDIAAALRVQWAAAHIEESVRQLGRGHPSAATDAFGSLWRFPRHVPKAAAKLLMSRLLSEQAETRLRQVLLRG